MKQTKTIMGMSVVIEVVDPTVSQKDFDDVFSYFNHVDETFSTYKNDSEISKINRDEILDENWSAEMKEIFRLADETKKLTDGYFDIVRSDGAYDPSGIVKGWAIYNGAKILDEKGFKNFSVEAGGDIEVRGKNKEGKEWSIGIRDPRDTAKKNIVKVVYGTDIGIATSGTYLLGQHIYNPHQRDKKIQDVVSITVVGKNIFEADRFATAAFAMGKEGIYLIEKLDGLEGYMIDKDGIATETTGFGNFTKENIYENNI